MTRSISKWVMLAALCLIFAGWLFASPVGIVSGFVKDATGALVPGVKVTLTNTATNAKLDTTTNASGEFQFLQLAPATYSLAAEAQGFKKISVPSVLVQVDQITHLELTLEVGSLTESVQVEGVAPLLENDKSTLSSVVNSHDISNMPLNARQVLDLALVTPGAVPTGAGTQGLGFNVSGARAQSNVFMWDGVSNMDTQINSPLNAFRITDAVQEFSVQTSVASAEFGRGTGGEVDVVTKSGTNAVHGSLFEYLRNSDLDATDFFINKAKGTKTPLHRNQFGGTVGGPIKHDKTFFFASYEEFRQVAPTPSLTRVPTSAERAQVTDPISRALLKFWPDPNASVGSNNFIANVGATDFDYTGLIRIDHELGPHDHLSGRFADFQGALFTPGALPALGGNANTPVTRNGSLVENHTFTPTLLNEFRIGYSRNQTFITVQDSGFNAASVFQNNGQPLPGVVDGSKNLLDSGLPTITVSGGFAPLGSTSNLPQGRITNTTELFDNVSWVAPFGASKHSFRFGYHVRREQARRFLDGNARGVFNFVNWSDFAAGLVNQSFFRSGSTLAYWDRFPWDLYWQDQYKPKDNLTINYGFRYEYPSAIYQTRFDATNFIPGVGPVLLGTNQLLTIDPNKTGRAAFKFAQAPFTLSDSGVHSDKNNFAPVIGLAYTPRFAKKLFGNDDTVIRLGFRVGYDDIFNNIPANLGLNAPYTLSTTQTANVTQPGKFPWAIGYDQNVPLVKLNPDGGPKVGLVGFNAEDPNIRSSYLYQYNLGIQRKLSEAFSIEVDYQGSAGHKLGMFVDQNQPQVIVNDRTLRGNLAPNVQLFPYNVFGAVGTGSDIGNSIYNGMVAIAKYQSRHGYFLQASYVVSKSIDDVSAFFGSTGERSAPADSHHVNLERGPSSFDTREHASILYSMDLPVGPGHRVLGWDNAFNRQVFGGWTVSGLVTAQTGQPFTVYDISQDYSGFNQFDDRPDVIGTGPLPQNNNNPDAAFGTPGAGRGLGFFSNTPPTGRVGTSGRNQYYGPGLFNWDLAAAKNIAITENRFRLQFRADFFNLFNNTNFANPQHDESSALFGKITSTLGSAIATSVGTTAGAYGGPRQIQFSMRLIF
ncbi:MAG TPA: carboxypeptidase regulatory-like domain-containing protein [Bryobacteraceae bacterium]|nr:carboxypeptidase regulatory-like domain-containing protein [Bryobacteraceae bacterium]